MTTWEPADVEEIVKDLQIKHLPVEEIVRQLTDNALSQFIDDRNHVKQLLWDEKIDDAEGDRLISNHIDDTGEWITAIHLWAKGGQK